MKIKNIFGNEYSGTMGKAFIASHIGRTYYLKQYTKPTDARTGLQLQRRAVFRNAITAWHKLSRGEKEEYNKTARQAGKRGYNLFIGTYLQAQNN